MSNGIGLETLRAVCSTNPIRPHLHAPFGVEIGGARWTVGTDGMRLLAARGDFGVAMPTDVVVQEALKRIAQWHADASTEAASIDIAPLKAFFAAHAPRTPETCPECNGEPSKDCEECGGVGETECECLQCNDVHGKQCRACGGKGTFVCASCRDRDSKIPVVVDGVAYDARIMSPFFALLPDGDVLFRQRGPQNMTTLATDDWFAAIMPLRVDDTRDMPRLDIAPTVAA